MPSGKITMIEVIIRLVVIIIVGVYCSSRICRLNYRRGF